jgi:hypothetical protein
MKMKSLIIALIWTLALVLAGNAGAQAPMRPFECECEPAPRGRIDELVFGRLRQLGIKPARGCSDEVFLRRAYLDVIGTLPTAAEAERFLTDSSPNKRQTLIERLMERSEFADYWAMKWCDLLRVKSEFPINLWPNAVQAYHRWIRTCVKENVPYDKFVRELLTASGSNFCKPQVNFYRALQSRKPAAVAQAVALTFMGTRTEKWPTDRSAGMEAFFSLIGYKPTMEWKEEIVLFDVENAESEASIKILQTAMFPDGTPARLSPDQDPRMAFADWLITPKNPWFARNIANRVWAWLLGRGIIHEPDDIRPDNPPNNPELLAYLEQELIANRYDLKHLYRLILNSQTYQLSHIPRGEAAEAQFAVYPMRRLEAEVLIDALCQVSGTTEQYSSRIPEPFTFMPEGRRAIALADASISSPFLEEFGRSPRDTGLESERISRPTAGQQLHLLNSSHIRQKIEQGPKLQSLLRSGNKEVVTQLYLMILSRFPTKEDLQVVATDASGGLGKGLSNLAWALINSPEFLYRH